MNSARVLIQRGLQAKGVCDGGGEGGENHWARAYACAICVCMLTESAFGCVQLRTKVYIPIEGVREGPDGKFTVGSDNPAFDLLNEVNRRFLRSV